MKWSCSGSHWLMHINMILKHFQILFQMFPICMLNTLLKISPNYWHAATLFLWFNFLMSLGHSQSRMPLHVCWRALISLILHYASEATLRDRMCYWKITRNCWYNIIYARSSSNDMSHTDKARYVGFPSLPLIFYFFSKFWEWSKHPPLIKSISKAFRYRIQVSQNCFDSGLNISISPGAKHLEALSPTWISISRCPQITDF